MNVRETTIHLGNHLPRFMTSRFRHNSMMARAMRPMFNHMVPSGPRLISVINGPARGARLSIYPRQEKYYWTGNHESHVQTALERTLQEGDCFWDVGAHIGLFSIIASRRVGATGRVHAFEPMPANRSRLRTSIDASGCANVEILDEALSEVRGRAVLHRHESSLVWSLGETDSHGDGESVTCLTLDDVYRREGIPTFVKIDAEGAELEVLRGGTALFAEAAPRIIVEFTDGARLQGARELLPNYRFRNIGENHWILDPR